MRQNGADCQQKVVLGRGGGLSTSFWTLNCRCLLHGGGHLFRLTDRFPKGLDHVHTRYD